MEIDWVDGSVLRVTIDKDTVVISANLQGLLSLAKHLVVLAKAMPGQHIHYDEYNSLEEGSAEMIIERINWNNTGNETI